MTIIKYALIMLILPHMLFSSYAHDENRIEAGKNLIDSGAPCSEFSDEDLEMVGDYYMEQAYPRQLHDQMDLYLGVEGSETFRENHIAMAKRIYCEDYEQVSFGSHMGVSVIRGDSHYYMMETNYPSRNMFFWGMITSLSIVVVAIIVSLVILSRKKR